MSTNANAITNKPSIGPCLFEVRSISRVIRISWIMKPGSSAITTTLGSVAQTKLEPEPVDMRLDRALLNDYFARNPGIG
jgi:hypothetical protein